jgi:hypothetical protein
MAELAQNTQGPLEQGEAAIEWGTDEAHQLLLRAHEICGHPTAVEIVTDLSRRAEMALSEARHVLDQAGEIAFEDETETEPWDGASWIQAAYEYHATRGTRPAIAEIEPDKLQQLQALLADASLQRAWNATNSTPGRAAASTVAALTSELRERGMAALDDPDNQRRLSGLSDEQLLDLAARLQRLGPEIASAWSADKVEALIQLRENLR